MAILQIRKDNFEELVSKAEKPVLLDFWASWCGPCRMLAPTIAETAEEYAGKIKVGKVNVDEQEALAIQYQIQSIPAVFLFKNGQVANVSIGLRPKNEIEELLK